MSTAILVAFLRSSAVAPSFTRLFTIWTPFSMSNGFLDHSSSSDAKAAFRSKRSVTNSLYFSTLGWFLSLSCSSINFWNKLSHRIPGFFSRNCKSDSTAILFSPLPLSVVVNWRISRTMKLGCLGNRTRKYVSSNTNAGVKFPFCFIERKIVLTPVPFSSASFLLTRNSPIRLFLVLTGGKSLPSKKWEGLRLWCGPG